MQDLNDKITGGTLAASEWNQVPSEIQNVITGTSQTLSAPDLNQLGKGISTLVGEADYYTVSGTANAIVMTPVAGREAPQRYSVGMRVRGYTATPNTSACTVNVAGLGIKAISKGYGVATACVGWEVAYDFELIYDGTRFYPYQNEKHFITVDTTVTVGSGYDYPTITSALERIVRLARPAYLNTGVTVTLVLQAGFVMAEQVIVDGMDLSWLKIAGVDASTVVTRSALTITPFGGYYPAFCAMNGATLPLISQHFAMDNSGTSTDRVGVLGRDSKIMFDRVGSGFSQAVLANILAYNCDINVEYAKFNDCSGGSNINMHSCRIYGVFVEATGANSASIHAQRGTTGTVASGNLINSASGAVLSSHGSNIDVQGAVGDAGITQFFVSVGGLIAANGVTGNISQAANVPTANGIIFQ